MLVRFVNVFCLLAIVLCLSACSKPPRYTVIVPSKEALQQDYIGLLNKTGAQVAQQGDTVKVMIPSDMLFKTRSANLQEDAWPMLGRLAAFLPLYNPASIQVSGYTDDSQDEKYQHLLTERQAQTIIDVLWPNGVGASMTYAMGYGSAFPIALNDSDTGRELNRRIEVVFRYHQEFRPYD